MEEKRRKRVGKPRKIGSGDWVGDRVVRISVSVGRAQIRQDTVKRGPADLDIGLPVADFSGREAKC